MTEPTSTLFVYGLLRSDMSAGLQRFVPGMAALRGRASVAGRLYDLGDYPGLVLGDGNNDSDGGDGGGELVVGEVWGISDPAAWATLDAFEDVRADGTGQYRRETITVAMVDGRRVLAQAYLYNRDAGGFPIVGSGDWARRGRRALHRASRIA